MQDKYPLMISKIEEHIKNLEHTLKWYHQLVYLSGFKKDPILKAYIWDIEIEDEIDSLKFRIKLLKMMLNEKILTSSLFYIMMYEFHYPEFNNTPRKDFINIYAHLIKDIPKNF